MARTRRYKKRFQRRARGRSLAAKVSRLAKVVKRTKVQARIESDYYLTYASNLANQDRSATIACQDISPNPVYGTTFDSRQTPTIRIQSLKLAINTVTTDGANVVRVQCFMLPDPFQTSLGAQTLFNPYNSTVMAPSGPLIPPSLASQKYHMIYDSGPRPCGTGGGLHPLIAWTKNINMKGRAVHYGSATTGQNPAQERFYVVVWSEDSPGAGPTYITNTTATVAYQWTYTS